MRRFFVGAIAMAWVSACQCNPASRCVSGSECGPNSVCRDGFCVAGVGGGGGTAGGGAAGGSGGGTAGGSGGGVGGGATVLTWKAPDAGIYYSGSLPISLKLNVSAPSLPSSVPFNATGPCPGGSGTGTLTGGGPDYTTGFGGGDCVWTVVATHNSVNASITFTIDRTPPVVSTTVPSSPGRPGNETDPFIGSAFKRDEIFTVKVDTNEPVVAPPVVNISGPLRDGGYSAFAATGVTLQAPSVCCGGAQNCNCYAVDISQPPFEAFNGTMKLQAIATDRGGLVGTSVTNSFAVSRWRWSQQLFAASSVPRSPGLTDNGDVIIGAGLPDAGSGLLVERSR